MGNIIGDGIAGKDALSGVRPAIQQLQYRAARAINGEAVSYGLDSNVTPSDYSDLEGKPLREIWKELSPFVNISSLYRELQE